MGLNILTWNLIGFSNIVLEGSDQREPPPGRSDSGHALAKTSNQSLK